MRRNQQGRTIRRSVEWMGLLVIILAATSGCAKKSPGFQGVPTDGIARRVTVYYGTDRAATSDDPDNVTYGGKRAYLNGNEPYQFDVCKVEIRRERNADKMPPLPKSGEQMVSLVANSLLERREFYGRLRDIMWNAGSNETFVFVHGFNNSFEDAATRTAELWYDLGFQGPPIMYSWPSRGGTLGYFADGATIEWSSANLKHFLLQLASETSARKLQMNEPTKIHLIAHSMGCRALLGALALIADELESGEQPLFCEVIIAAPDVDLDVFRDVIAPRLIRHPVAEHYTLYSSSSDKALHVSEKLQTYRRAGSAVGSEILVGLQNLTAIDVSNITADAAGMKHDYFISEPAVLRDMIQMLVLGNRNPGSAGRLMRRNTEVPGDSWVMVEAP